MFSRLRARAKSAVPSSSAEGAASVAAAGGPGVEADAAVGATSRDGAMGSVGAMTMTMEQRAAQMKELGNKAFAQGDFKTAEDYYMQGIRSLPSLPLHTNLALTHIKLGNHVAAAEQAEAAMALDSSNMKAHYYLSQALGLRPDPKTDDALANALQALDLCVVDMTRNNGKGMGSLAMVTDWALRCYRARWDEKAHASVRRKEWRALHRRERRRTEIVQTVESIRIKMLADGKDMSVVPFDKYLAEMQIAEEAEDEEDGGGGDATPPATPGSAGAKKPPDWLIDDISFEPMIDPVMTKNGNSFERASIMKHLERSQTDPLTREPLTVADLRPNLALRGACREYLMENGWAVDW